MILILNQVKNRKGKVIVMYGVKEKEIEELMEIGYTRYQAKERLQKEREIAILMEDRCTKKRSRKTFKDGFYDI